MNFEVNGIPYILTYDAGEEQWRLLTASGNGIEAVEIHHDRVPMHGRVPQWNDQGGSQHLN